MVGQKKESSKKKKKKKRETYICREKERVRKKENFDRIQVRSP